MRDRERMAAERFGLLEKIEDLERELLKVDHVAGVEFDLDGFYSDIYQVIVLPEYDIPVGSSNYFTELGKTLQEVIAVTNEFGLGSSGDQIENYGKHFYIVRNCDSSWVELAKQHVQEKNVDEIIEDAGLRSENQGALERKNSVGKELM